MVTVSVSLESIQAQCVCFIKAAQKSRACCEKPGLNEMDKVNQMFDEANVKLM